MLHRLKTEYKIANMFETFEEDNKSTVKNISEKPIVKIKLSSVHIVDVTHGLSILNLILTSLLVFSRLFMYPYAHLTEVSFSLIF